MACCLGSKDKEYLTDNDEDTVMGELDFTPPLLLLDITRWKFLSYSLQTVVLRFRIIRALQLFRYNYLKYNIFDEGWSIEYDGIDPGYLSASCSFFSKTLEVVKNKEILEKIPPNGPIVLNELNIPLLATLSDLAAALAAASAFWASSFAFLSASFFAAASSFAF